MHRQPVCGKWHVEWGKVPKLAALKTLLEQNPWYWACIPPRRDTMTRMPIRLNPTSMGMEAELFRLNLGDRIVGQDDAIRAIVDVYQAHRTGLNMPGRP